METTRRPSSLGLSMASANGSRRSILKKESFIDVHEDLDRAMASVSCETPEQFFQRVLAQRKMSPLDLCDAFCFGDARKHRHVALKHVCEVLFELENPGCDPMSDAMEEFLYQFAFDGGDGEIVVDIKEALRTLDIWKTSAPSSPTKLHQAGSSTHPNASVSPAKAAMLEVKAEKLKKVIDSLQHENLRLSRALSSSTQSEVSSETRPPSPLRIAVKKPTQDSVSSNTSPQQERLGSPAKQQQPSPTKVVSRHERDLIALANRLEYAGVRKLEELLRKDDTASGSGFVSLKQLRWLLANECRVGEDVSEAKLMELCLGMNFNAQGQLDFQEFIRVLLDILVYESRPSRLGGSASTSGDSQLGLSEADEALLQKMREYLRGFYGSREKTRELLDGVCDKYDLEGNQWLALTEMVRVFQSDLASQHPVKLKLPLTQSETRKLLLSLAETSPRHPPKTDATAPDATPFVYYPVILDAIFHAESHARAGGKNSNNSPATQAFLARVLAPEFWTSLRSALCPHDNNPALERKIHAQLCKILLKLDPKRSFRIAQRHFVRVFDQHWSSRDLDALAEALSNPLDGRATGEVAVRYDVLMRLLFGAPELRDGAALASIVSTLSQDSAHWRDELTELVHASGGHHHKPKKLTYHDTYELLCGQSSVLNVTEFLYLAAHLQDETHLGSHRIDAEKLWTLLIKNSKAHSPRKTKDGSTDTVDTGGGQTFTLLRRCLRVLCDDHALEKALARLCRHERGVVRVDELANTLSGQLRVLQLSQQDQNDVREDIVLAFLDSVTQREESSSPGSDLLYTHALMDAIFDWDALTAALKLPDRLVDVKKTLELFDWERNGSIDADDWNKAWRQLTVRSRVDKNTSQAASQAPLQDWAMRVLVRRFPGGPSDKRARRSTQGLGAIDYSRLLVFLLERQQRLAREQLQAAVLMLLQQTCERVTQGKRHVTTFHLESAFEAIDRDGKGYFHIGDLRAFVLDQLRQARDSGMAVQTLETYASQGPALESVMAHLVGEKPHGSKKQVVSLMRFQELMNHGFCQHNHHTSRTSSHRRSRHSSQKNASHSGEDDDDTSSAEESTETEDGYHRRGRSTSKRAPLEGQITLLRDLELCIFEISKPFLDAHGQISPAAAYAHLNGSTGTKQPRRPHSQSPVRSSLRSSSTSLSASYNSAVSSRRSSCTTPRTISETYDPLTASRLKQTLRSAHGIETSTHLIGQFFLRLGSSTKHFLELALFAKWLSPLSGSLQARVKQVVREMLVKSKSGGGHVDLERFVGAVERKLADAQMTEDAMAGRHHSHGSRREGFDGAPRTVRPGALLTRLHQLNVSLRKPEMAQLLRHFGMEDQLEIDFGLFLRRLYELAQQLPMHTDRQ